MIIMAVDPGITHMGIAILRPNNETKTVDVLKRYHIEGYKLCREKKHLLKQFTKQLNVIIVYGVLFRDIIQEWGVTDIVSEGAFSYAIPAAVISLTRVILTLELASYELLKRPVSIVSPQFVKKAWTGSGDKSVSKDDMRNRYLGAKDVIGDMEREAASEHEIDAVAHGFAYLSRDVWGTVQQAIKVKKKRKKKGPELPSLETKKKHRIPLL